jgi:hypothetical protein
VADGRPTPSSGAATRPGLSSHGQVARASSPLGRVNP